MRVSTKTNKGQFISARYKDTPNAKPAAKPTKPRQPAQAQAPLANIVLPAVNVNNPISDEIKEKN